MGTAEEGKLFSLTAPFFVDDPLERFEDLTVDLLVFNGFIDDLPDCMVVVHARYGDISERKDGGVVESGVGEDVPEGEGIGGFRVELFERVKVQS